MRLQTNQMFPPSLRLSLCDSRFDSVLDLVPRYRFYTEIESVRAYQRCCCQKRGSVCSSYAVHAVLAGESQCGCLFRCTRIWDSSSGGVGSAARRIIRKPCAFLPEETKVMLETKQTAMPGSRPARCYCRLVSVAKCLGCLDYSKWIACVFLHLFRFHRVFGSASSPCSMQSVFPT